MPRPARPWFRFYVEAFADRKLRRLRPEVRWLFAACIGVARQSPDPGRLLIGEEPAEVDDLADFAALTPAQVRRGVKQLLDGGLLVRDDNGVLDVPAFRHRQFESDNVTERTRKHRSKERSNNGRRNAPEAEADTETEPGDLPVAAAARSGGRSAADARRETLERSAAIIGRRAADRPGVTNPAACARAVARAVITDRHHDAYAHLALDPTLSAEALADLLEPPEPPKPQRPLLPPNSAPEHIADFDHHPSPKRPPDPEGLATIASLRSRFPSHRPPDPGDAA